MSNDVSERKFQLGRGGQWDSGENGETFNPIGPSLLTADELRDPQCLGLRTWANGELRQEGSTKDTIFGGVDYLGWYLRRFIVLRPGDVTKARTPAGVALCLPSQQYLRAGDVVELEIDGLGRQCQIFGEA